jgi:hypothetical protein
MTDVMLDLETISTFPNAKIVVIGAIKFSRNKHLKSIKSMDCFYRRISLESMENLDLHQDLKTMNWWDEQSADVRYEALENPDRISLKQALEDFTKWIGGNTKRIWGNGDDFDCVILESAYRVCGLEKPWHFWNTRDLRTLMDIGGLKKKDLPTGNEHNALYDCYRQIAGAKIVFGKLV